MEKLKKLLIVASFPTKTRNIVGGIERSSRILKDSKWFNDFELIKFDTSQISHPPPNLFIRFILAILRLFRLVYTLIFNRPRTILIFCSDGFSALEKGTMILLSKLFFVKSLIFPRAGNLMIQTKKNKLFKTLIKLLFRTSDLFLCQGPVWYKYAINDLKVDKARAEIINNWTATSELIKVGKERLISDKESLEILFVGWLERQKGINELIKVFHKLQKKYEIKIKFIGDGSLKKKIDEYSVKNNLQNYITTLGWVNNDEILKKLKSADIFVLPSWQEGMPNSLIEALAAGLPSICSSVGSIPDYIYHNHNGLLIEPKNQLDLEKNLEKLIEDVDLRKKLSKNAVMIAEKEFSSDVSLKKLSMLIKSI